MMNLCLSKFALVSFTLAALVQAAPSFDTKKIEEITGLKGVYTESEGVFKVSSPRNDIKVTVDKLQMPPFMGLTSWAAFKAGSGKSNLMVMGDLVLFQDEVNTVMSAALDAGLEVTALHNHFFFDEPKVYFMHIGGDGELVDMATGIRKAIDAVRAVRSSHPTPQTTFGLSALPSSSSISPKPIEDIFGLTPAVSSGMVKVVIGRTVTMSCGCEMTKEMGVNTWAAFYGTDSNAIVDGDFAVHEDELQKVLKSLRGDGINIVAIHHHMAGESPKMLFLHYWGQGAAKDLAGAVKKALVVDEKDAKVKKNENTKVCLLQSR